MSHKVGALSNFGSDDPAIGTCPTIRIQVGTTSLTGLLDTGSQVCMMTDTYFEEHLAPCTPSSPPTNRYKFTAANGTDIPYVGFCTVDVYCENVYIPGLVIFITPHNPSRPPFIVGMSLLKYLPPFKTLTASSPNPKSSLAHLPNTPTLVPAKTVMTVSATCPPQLSSPVLIEPVNGAPPGIVTVQAVSYPSKGYLPVTLMNPTDEDILIPPKTKIGLIEPASVANVSVVTEDSKSVEVDFSKFPLGGDLSPEERSNLEALVTANSDVFAWSEDQLGLCDLLQHRIVVTSDQPTAQPYRRLPPQLMAEVRNHLDSLLDRDIIAPSTSPYAAPIVVVRKKNNEIRMCCDFRKLNAITRKDSYPLPRMEECIDALAGARVFSTLDLASGYHQTEVHPEDQDKTAFTTPFGLFQWKRLPFGLCNAPAQFSRVMQKVMSDHLFKILVLYLDDILVYSDTFESHLTRLGLVFQRLRQVGLKLNPEKCQLGRKSVNFLGHVLTSEGLFTDPDKISAVQNFPKPQTVKQVRSFLGLCNYYRKFVKGFATIAKPLSSLLAKTANKNQKLGDRWDASCDQAFDTLKAALTSAPVLAYADFSKSFVVDVDASLHGLGAVLSQEINGQERVIAYASRGLSPSEKNMKNYSSRKLELLALKWSVTEKFRSYLLGSRFVVRTDNNPVVHLATSKLSACEQRWEGELSAFDFEVIYRPGRVNRNADALSRNPVGGDLVCPTEVYAVHATAIPPLPVSTVACNAISSDSSKHSPLIINPCPILETPVECGPSLTNPCPHDPEMDPLVPFLKQGRKPGLRERCSLTAGAKRLLREWNRLSIQHDHIVRRIHTVEGPVFQRVIGKDQQVEAMRRVHDLCGHQGPERCLEMLRPRVFWPSMSQDVFKYCSSCHRCQVAKVPTFPIHRAPSHISANYPLETVAMDFTLMDRASNGSEIILVLTDVFSKWTMAVPVPDQTALTTCKILIKHWFPIFGPPAQLHSDKGSAFESQVIQHLCHHYGVEKTRTASYNPSCNGQTERFNRTLHNLLRSLTPEEKRQWPKYLPELLYWYNAAPHSSTGVSPYTLLFGQSPPLPIDSLCSSLCPDTNTTAADDYVRGHFSRLEELRDRVLQKTSAARDHADLKPTRGTVLCPGDLVLLRDHPPGRTKITDKFKDSIYTVTMVPGPTCRYYVVRDSESQQEFAVTCSEMRKYTPRDSVCPQTNRPDTIQSSEFPGTSDSRTDSEDEMQPSCPLVYTAHFASPRVVSETPPSTTETEFTPPVGPVTTDVPQNLRRSKRTIKPTQRYLCSSIVYFSETF